MTEDEQKALRLLLREEVNAAVYASEQRIGVRLGRIDEHLDQLDTRMHRFEDQLGRFEDRLGRFEDRLGRFDERLNNLEAAQRKMQVDLSEITSVLNVATRVINEIQAAQVALELKVEDNSRSLKRDMQGLTDTVHNFTRQLIEVNRQTVERILLHERTPIDEAHPRPNSAA
jgi:archaellum component FlaC